ncbi:hypothetical protein Q5P01_001490 [Channa striata]|uniref:Uncharacterized protein n=1 Tax=Channa striata TaxID=64152 RepID=A0AA88NN08_CHASR|nr:hypothetical protein Q5P01_001490 [Channa striata]
MGGSQSKEGRYQQQRKILLKSSASTALKVTGYYTHPSFPSGHGSSPHIPNCATSGYVGHAPHCHPGEVLVDMG